jgi:hypothetical protein
MPLSKDKKRMRRAAVQPMCNLKPLIGVRHPVPYPVRPTPKQEREWGNYKTELRGF